MRAHPAARPHGARGDRGDDATSSTSTATASTGESFSIADPQGGLDPGDRSARARAARGRSGSPCACPTGMICRATPTRPASASSRSTTRPTASTRANVIDFAIEQGLLRPEAEDGRSASATSTARPTRAEAALHRDPRVVDLPPRRAVAGALARLPPRRRRARSPIRCGSSPTASCRSPDVMALMRDHYEGTRLRHDAGRRRRPLRLAATLAADDLEGRRRGPTPGSGRSPPSRPAARSVANSRGLLPDAVGGVLWYGLDDTYTTLLLPALLPASTPCPPSFAGGSLPSSRGTRRGGCSTSWPTSRS